jgi:hypothetical protein
MADGPFDINPRLMHETIEGETIMINGETGNYYSLNSVGSAIWRAIEANAAPDQIVRFIAARYEAPRDEIRAAVNDFLAELEREELVVRGGAAGEPRLELLAVDSAVSTTSPFSRPSLEKHTDMQDLILLDPVHEVDPQRGWPHAGSPQPERPATTVPRQLDP